MDQQQKNSRRFLGMTSNNPNNYGRDRKKMNFEKKKLKMYLRGYNEMIIGYNQSNGTPIFEKIGEVFKATSVIVGKENSN
jgi:hypothetical protein